MIVCAFVLTVAIIAQLSTLLDLVLNCILVIMGKKDAYASGEVFGTFIYWFAHFLLTFTLWKYGIRWVRKKSEMSVRIISTDTSKVRN